jgi:hypothetical protein
VGCDGEIIRNAVSNSLAMSKGKWGTKSRIIGDLCLPVDGDVLHKSRSGSDGYIWPSSHRCMRTSTDCISIPSSSYGVLWRPHSCIFEKKKNC